MPIVRSHSRIKGLSLINVIDAVPTSGSFLCTYVLRCNKTALVDAGATAGIPEVLDGLKKLGIAEEEVHYLICTHAHADHAGGTAALLRHLPNALAVIPRGGAIDLENPSSMFEGLQGLSPRMAKLYGMPEPVASEKVIRADDGMVIDLGEKALEVMFTPGHTRYHASFIDRDSGLLFVGDSCGTRANGIRRPAVRAVASIKPALASLQRMIDAHPSTVCYGHLGWEDSATARLMMCKEQLLLWCNTMAEGMAKGRSTTEIVDDIVRKDRMLSSLRRMSEADRDREMRKIGGYVVGLTKTKGIGLAQDNSEEVDGP